jgi:hypothetical protein
MATTPNNREARRRKIVERGSDRLALITGRIHNLPSSPSAPGSSPLSHYPSPFSPSYKDEAFGSVLQKLEKIADDAGHGDGYDGRRRTETSLSGSGPEVKELMAPASEIRGVDKSEMRSEASKVHGSENNRKLQSSPPNETEQCVDLKGNNKQGTLTSTQIISAITVTESLRLWCSVAVALLVVLSHIGFPLLGCNFIKNIISFRPLYLVLLTNITIVISRLLLENRGGLQWNRQKSKNPATDNNNWTDHVGTALEISMVVQKSIEAAFIDCSVYAVIVVCGLFLV